MTKKEKEAIEREVREEFHAIRNAVELIARKMANTYEIEIYKRLSQLCNQQIEIINEVNEYSVGLACNKIKNVMKGEKDVK